LTTGGKYDLYLKFRYFNKGKVPDEVDHEKNVPTKQCQAKEDARVYGEDEHEGRAQCFETEKIERKKETDRVMSPNS